LVGEDNWSKVGVRELSIRLKFNEIYMNFTYILSVFYYMYYDILIVIFIIYILFFC